MLDLTNKEQVSDELKLRMIIAKTKVKKAFNWAVQNPVEAALLMAGAGTLISACGNARNNAVRRKVWKAEAESKKAYARFYNNR